MGKPDQKGHKEETETMKKILSLALVLMLGLSLLPNVAMAAEGMKLEPVREYRFPDIVTPTTAFTIENTGDTDLEVTVDVYDQGARQNVQTMTFTILKGDAPLPVDAYVYRQLTRNGETNTYRYTVKTKNGLTRYIHFAQKLTIVKDANGNETYVYDGIFNPYFPRNTVSSLGHRFRDVTPELTDLWYMFTPIDLSIQGRQTFVLIASNMYEVGEVYVDVNLDTVNVSYIMYDEGKSGFTTERLSEFITFYNSYADVGIVEPEDMKEPSIFAFNQPFSILNHLGGDTNVLMFIRNRISYYRFNTPKTEYTRFWENKPEYKVIREHMLQMMDPIMTVDEGK